MTDKEKIIAEIERLKNCKSNLEEDTEYLRGYDFAIETLEEFINSLPAEQPREELNKEIDSFLADNVGKINNVGQIARHFAQWQKEQMMKNCLYDTEVMLRTKQNYTEYLTLAKDKLLHIPVSLGLNVGDKVKILIIKENE